MCIRDRDVTVDKVKKTAKKKASPIYKNLDAIVIDEISMVRSDLLDLSLIHISGF